MRFCIAVLLVSAVFAQPTNSFEAVSVRPSAPNTKWGSSTTDRSQFVSRGSTLVELIANSYPDVLMWRISGGPSWVTSDRWDFVAKLPPEMPSDQEHLWRKTEAMLRKALAEEFKLQTHFEPREEPVFKLVVAKGGARVKPSAAAEFGSRLIPNGIEVRHVEMFELATMLYCGPACPRMAADRVVVDRTGLKGYYDFTLTWAPSNIVDGDNQQPSIYTAVQEQLGLKLEPGKALVDYLIIDRAERSGPPGQN